MNRSHVSCEPSLSYRVAGIGLRLSGESSDSLARFARWFETNFYTRLERTAPADITLHIATQPPLEPTLATAPLVYQSASLQIRRQVDRCFLLLNEATCEFDLQTRHGILWLTPGFWRLPRKRQQEPVLLTLVWLLRECRRYSLHASAVARNGRVLVLAGESGSGKSTAALGLVHQGWHYLADDVVLLESTEEGPRLWGLARGFAYHSALLAQVPEPANPMTEQADLNGEKRFTDLDTVYPGRHLPCGSLRALVFPQIVAQARSRLLPLEPMESLSALFSASAGLLTDKLHATAQLEFLKTMVMQRPAYRLLAGRDIFGNGRTLEALLMAGGVLE
ncbi:MAG: hypothetical protein U1F76_08425 [Candidatus Competibacteraceae bacterium]